MKRKIFALVFRHQEMSGTLLIFALPFLNSHQSLHQITQYWWNTYTSYEW